MADGEYADISVDKAVTDGNLVSARAWPAHPDWIAQFLVVFSRRLKADWTRIFADLEKREAEFLHGGSIPS